MRSIGLVALVAAVACGGESVRRNETNDAGVTTGGTPASGGSGFAGAHDGIGGTASRVAGSTTGGMATGSSTTGGAGGGLVSIDLGDGDQADDGRPVPASSPGGFFWGGCGDSAWHLGNWFLTSDATRDSPVREIDPPRGGSTLARGVTGADFMDGVVLWVQLDHPFNSSVSLAGCTGIAFWGRLDSTSGQIIVALNDGSHSSGALDGSATLPSRTLAVGPDWQEFTLPFESFQLNEPSLASIEFYVGDAGESFDLWIDDLAFLCPDSCP